MGRRVLPLVCVLGMLGLAGTVFRSWNLGYPLFPSIAERVWGARLTVQWEPHQAPVSVLLPRETGRQNLRDERISSGALEVTIDVDADGLRRLRWIGEGAVAAGYEAEIVVRPQRPDSASFREEDLNRWRRTDEFALPVVAAATRLAVTLGLEEGGNRCFDLITGRTVPPSGFQKDLSWVRSSSGSLAEALALCWRSAGFPARVVQALPLKAGIYTGPEFLAEVFENSRWTTADPDKQRFPADDRRLLVWTWGVRPLVESGQGTPIQWEIDLRERPLTLWSQFFQRTADRSSFLALWSVYRLPPDAQEVFRVLLLVPVGALVVALLRNVVGFATFGTFMPILIAVAFLRTRLLYGLVLFSLVVGVGYGVRLAIDGYKLLLVPRLATILTFVIGCLAALAVAGSQLHLQRVLSVGLLPMVILTMTIERFFVVVEESGPGAALKMAAGTAGVAAITYGIISWEYLQLVFFTYPELLLLVTAGQIALGRYVGFRLTELWRFRRLTGSS